MRRGLPATGSAGRGAQTAAEADANRRSVYIFVKRNAGLSDARGVRRAESAGELRRRFRTVIPSQALILMNDQLVLEWSRALAGRVLNDGGLSPEQQVDRAYRLALSRPPNAEERTAVLDFLQQAVPLIDERLARNEKPPLPDQFAAGHGPGACRGVRRLLPYAAEFERVPVHELERGWHP